MRPRPARCLGILVLLSTLVPSLALAQAWLPREGRLLSWVSYQNLDVGDHCFSDDLTDGDTNYGRCVDFGDIRSHSVLVGLDFGVVEKLALSANLAYVAARYIGSIPDSPLDDGTWNEGFQDFGITLRYMLVSRPVVITPALGYGAPTHDYDVLGHTALGRGLQEGRVGINVGWVPSFLNRSYVEAGYTYAIVEKVEHVDNLNRSEVNLQLGYFITDSFSVRGSGYYRKVHGGIDWLAIGPHFEAHDQAAAIQDISVGGAIGYSLTPFLGASLGYNWTAWGENTHESSAFSFGLNYLFSLYEP